eukprot:Clim_evm25s143 gene=Clim_evmTU25s143
MAPMPTTLPSQHAPKTAMAAVSMIEGGSTGNVHIVNIVTEVKEVPMNSLLRNARFERIGKNKIAACDPAELFFEGFTVNRTYIEVLRRREYYSALAGVGVQTELALRVQERIAQNRSLCKTPGIFSTDTDHPLPVAFRHPSQTH